MELDGREHLVHRTAEKPVPEHGSVQPGLFEVPAPVRAASPAAPHSRGACSLPGSLKPKTRNRPDWLHASLAECPFAHGCQYARRPDRRHSSMAAQGSSSAVIGSIPLPLHRKLALACEPGSNCLRGGQMPAILDTPDETSGKSASTQHQSRTVPRACAWSVASRQPGWCRNAQAGSLVTATHDFPRGLRAEGMPMYSEGRP